VGKPAAEEPLSTLRGAGVTVDVGQATRVLVALLLVTLTVLVVIFFVAGAHKNAQITRLHTDGVPVQIRVSGCTGLPGGSGANQAGYSCRGTFTLDGSRHSEVIPGNVLRPVGTTLKGVAVPGDPQLLETARALVQEHSSARVFLLPVVLLAVLVIAVATLLLRRRRPGAASRLPPSS
jgi:hypothetical protein